MITQTVGRSSVTTAKKACRLRLTADRTCIRADGADLCYITADITDDQGTPVPDASSRVTFQIQGEGTIAGVDNGLSVDHEPYQSDSRRAFGGKVLAIVRAAAREGAFTPVSYTHLDVYKRQDWVSASKLFCILWRRVWMGYFFVSNM